MQPMENKLFDIHCHAMNLDHPNFLKFLKRFYYSLCSDISRVMRERRLLILTISVALIPVVPILLLVLSILLVPVLFLNKINTEFVNSLFCKIGFRKKVDNAFNILYIMQRNLGDFFLEMEKDCLSGKTYSENALRFENHQYSSMILTPLVMDFSSNDVKAFMHTICKPVTEQTTDLLNGIKMYREKSQVKFFEIYPFLGINPSSYSTEKILEIVTHYFNDYRGSYNDLLKNMGNFTGDLKTIGSNFFAGIKLYPPLGFDPWPEDESERNKVCKLYKFCVDRRIPITTHCSDEGFDSIKREEMLKFTSPEKWEPVLENFNDLKVNLAHFGKRSTGYEWRKIIIKFILKYSYVYTDISYCGVSDLYYREIRKTLDRNPEKVRERILFGSDYMMLLIKFESYNKYFEIFHDTNGLTEEEKHLFCSVNPNRFLFENVETELP